MKRKTLALATIATLAFCAPAQAGKFVFHYTADPNADFADPGSPSSATIFLTTSNTLNSAGGYDVLSATGSIDGTAITGISPNLDPPNIYGDGVYLFDNVLFTSGIAFSGGGIAVKTTLGEYNFGLMTDADDPNDHYFALFADGSTHISTHTGLPVPNLLTSEGTGSLSAAPEPASWAMMLVGFGLAGTAMRRRRTGVRFA